MRKSSIISWAMGIVGVLMLVAVAPPITIVSATGPSSSYSAGFEDDADVVLTPVGIRKISSTLPAMGDTSPGVETSNALPQVNTPLTRSNYAYTFVMKEARTGSWQPGESFKIEVYGDNGRSTPLLGTLYARQTSADDARVEGVTVIVDLGSTSTVSDRFDIIVTRR